MPKLRDRGRRVAVATKLLARDLFRRRIALVLLFVVPALFDAVVLGTTVSRQVEVTMGTLVDEGAAIETPESPADPLDTSLDDNGSRKLDERQLSLVFLGTAAVCFLACFLAFNLVHKRKDMDARLVLAGYGAHEVLVAKLLLLLGIVAALAVYETAILWPWAAPRHLPLLLAGHFSGGIHLRVPRPPDRRPREERSRGDLPHRLVHEHRCRVVAESDLLRHSQRRGLIESLPGYGPVQLSAVGALTDDVPHGALARSLVYAGALVAAALVVFWLRIAPPRDRSTARTGRMRWHFAKVLFVTYALWIAAFETVGRYAATLHTVDLTTAWDRAIPLVPAFVWPYELCYAVPLFALFVCATGIASTWRSSRWWSRTSRRSPCTSRCRSHFRDRPGVERGRAGPRARVRRGLLAGGEQASQHARRDVVDHGRGDVASVRAHRRRRAARHAASPRSPSRRSS